MFNLISKEKEKMKVINYYHFSTALQMCAVIGTVAAPLTLYSVELGLDPDRIGILGSLMAFCQVLALISIPLTCLLYTSPSPRDTDLSRMPSSA